MSNPNSSLTECGKISIEARHDSHPQPVPNILGILILKMKTHPVADYYGNDQNKKQEPWKNHCSQHIHLHEASNSSPQDKMH
jgi:hypothetical protein